MIRKSLLSILLLAGATAKLCAQEYKPRFATLSKADATFNMYDNAIHHRHKAWLGQGNTMTVELYTYNDFQKLQDLESLLATAREDLSFVADSIAQCPECSYRIDYLSTPAGMKSYRLQRFEPQGTFLYQKKGNDALKPFKSESDTLRLAVAGPDDRGRQCQVTFVLNRFANLDSLLAQKGRINRMVDTFRRLSAPRLRADIKYPWAYKTTIFLHKNARDTSKTLVDLRKGVTDRDIMDIYHHRPMFAAIANIGAGFVRDRIAPMASGGVVFTVPQTRGRSIRSIIGIYGSGYFSFERNADGAYTVNDNWFINAEIGDEGDNRLGDFIRISRLTVGAGYLVAQKGDYFRNTTMKVFMNIRMMSGITVSPELIATDNFKQVFPGLTVKVF